MRRSSSRHVVFTTLAAAVLLPLATNIATGQLPPWLSGYLWLAWPVSISLAVIVIIAEVRSARDPNPADTEPRLLDLAVAELAETNLQQWRAEAALRTLNQPAPIRVRWSLTSRPVSAALDSIMSTVGARSAYPAIEQHGDIDDVVDVLQRLPHRQLVVLGEPGAGKSVVALAVTLRLLERRCRTDPVPVLLSLASWNPASEHLTTWVARRLVEDHPGLASATRFGSGAAGRLVGSGRVVLILDGLDELPQVSHVDAIAGINDLSATGRSFVLTCRTQEYEQAVRCGGRALATALVMELHPVSIADAVDYLSRSGPAAAQRWAAVAARLDASPDTVIGRAFTVPLMVWLARMIYTDPATDPLELFDPVRFPNQQAMEGYLLDRLLPAVYVDSPTALGARDLPRYSADSARKWLTFLARGLSGQETSDLSWWEFHGGVPARYRVGVASALAAVVGAIFVLSLLLTSGWSPFTRLGLLLWPIFIPVVGLAIAARGAPRGPGRVVFQARTNLRRTLYHVWTGLLIGLGASVPFLLSGRAIVGVVMVVIGASVSFFMSLLHAPDVLLAATPGGLLRSDRQTLFALVVLGGAAGGVGAWSVGVLVGSVPVWLVGLPAGGFTGGLAATLRFRRVGILVGTACGAVIGAGAGVVVGGQVAGLLVVTTSGIAYGAGYGLVVSLKHLASPWYGISKIWFAIHGEVPWRLLRFLEDAHRRGILRQMGGVYQFRHLRLRDHLAANSN